MPRENVRVKSVHFNIKNTDDSMMLKAIGKKNFSRYVKQLIQADIKKELSKPQPVIKKREIKILPKQS